jgi:L-fucose isomerase-like protein
MNDTVLKAAVVLVSHTREPSSFSLSLLNEGIERLKKENIEILFSKRPLTTDMEVRDEIINLKMKSPDLYIIVPGNWIEPPVVCHPLEEIRHERILLWGFPESSKLIDEGHFLGSASAFSVLRNGMTQMGFKFKSVLGFPDEDEIITKIIDFISACHVSRFLKKVKLGLIGYLSMGIYTTAFDQLKIRKVFGTEIDCSADSYILFKKMQEQGEKEVSHVESELKNRCKVDEAIIKNGSLEKSVRMYTALKEMTEEGGWKGLTVKCQHEFSTYLKCTACLPLSMLTDEGIMCTDEGDIHALITMIIMKYLSNKNNSIYFGDIYKLREGGFLMGHCGLSPHSCAESEKEVALLPQNPRISKDGKTTGGVISSYNFKAGPVTIGRIENDREGSYIFHFCRGDVKPVPSMLEGISSLVFTPEGSATDFEENMLANHYIFVYGNITRRIEEFCNILELTIIK